MVTNGVHKLMFRISTKRKIQMSCVSRSLVCMICAAFPLKPNSWLPGETAGESALSAPLQHFLKGL